MRISKQSMFYQFLDRSWGTYDDPIPTNLCPFMRKVCVWILLYFFMYTIAVFVVIIPLFAFPLSFFLPGFFDEAFIGLGFIFWSIIIFGLFAWVLRKPLQKQNEKLQTMNSYQTAASWIRAIHDKVCPEVTFHDR